MEHIKEQLISDINFITGKLSLIRASSKADDNLDIKQMADFHRYAETRLFLVNTLKLLEGVVKKNG